MHGTWLRPRNGENGQARKPLIFDSRDKALPGDVEGGEHRSADLSHLIDTAGVPREIADLGSAVEQPFRLLSYWNASDSTQVCAHMHAR